MTREDTACASYTNRTRYPDSQGYPCFTAIYLFYQSCTVVYLVETAAVSQSNRSLTLVTATFMRLIRSWMFIESSSGAVTKLNQCSPVWTSPSFNLPSILFLLAPHLDKFDV